MTYRILRAFRLITILGAISACGANLDLGKSIEGGNVADVASNADSGISLTPTQPALTAPQTISTTAGESIVAPSTPQSSSNIFFEDFNTVNIDGTIGGVNSSVWQRYATTGGVCGSPPSNVNNIVTSGGQITFGNCNYIETTSAKTFSSNKYVIEGRFAGTGGGRNTYVALKDANNSANQIFIGDTNYSATASPGLYVYQVQNNNFVVDARGLMPSVASFKEYRITIDGVNVTIERGESLANLTEIASATLSSTVNGKTFLLRLGTAGAPYYPGVFDWVRVSTSTASTASTVCTQPQINLGGICVTPTSSSSPWVNVLLGGTFTDSCASCPPVAPNALTNGNLDDGQNLRTYSGTFSINVASPITLDRLILYPWMTPNGTVSYEIQTSTSSTGAPGTWTSHGIRAGAMANEVPFPIALGTTVSGVRVVKVIITSSPSWVALAEVEGYLGDAPNTFYDVFRASTLDLNKWRIDPAVSQPTPINATYSILAATGELIVDVPGGSDGAAGVASGNKFVARTGNIFGDFEMTMSAEELLRLQSGTYKDNSGMFLFYGGTLFGITGNYSGYWPNFTYGTYNKHRVWAVNSNTGTTCLIDESFDQSVLFALEFRMRRVGPNGYVAYRIKGNANWAEYSCPMDSSAEAGFYFWSGDGGNTRSAGRFKGSVDTFVLKTR
jgi:hypothetical protein